MGKPREDAEVFLVLVRNMLVHHALQAQGDKFVLLTGLTQIASGLEILSAELKAMDEELDDIKDLLLQMQKRRP